METLVQTLHMPKRQRATRRLTLTTLALAAGLAVLAPASAPAQSLNGQPVSVTLRSPKTTILENYGTQTIITTGNTFTDAFDGINIFVTPTQIVFSDPNIPSTGFGSPGFFGYAVSETTAFPSGISSVTVNAATTVSGFGTGRVSFDSGDVFADFNGLNLKKGQNVTLDLTFAPAAVPEPAPALTFAVASLGLGGLMVAARRKKGASSL